MSFSELRKQVFNEFNQLLQTVNEIMKTTAEKAQVDLTDPMATINQKTSQCYMDMAKFFDDAEVRLRQGPKKGLF